VDLGVQVVERDDAVVRTEQPLSEGAADEPRAAGHQHGARSVGLAHCRRGQHARDNTGLHRGERETANGAGLG